MWKIVIVTLFCTIVTAAGSIVEQESCEQEQDETTLMQVKGEVKLGRERTNEEYSQGEKHMVDTKFNESLIQAQTLFADKELPTICSHMSVDGMLSGEFFEEIPQSTYLTYQGRDCGKLTMKHKLTITCKPCDYASPLQWTTWEQTSCVTVVLSMIVSKSTRYNVECMQSGSAKGCKTDSRGKIGCFEEKISCGHWSAHDGLTGHLEFNPGRDEFGGFTGTGHDEFTLGPAEFVGESPTMLGSRHRLNKLCVEEPAGIGKTYTCPSESELKQSCFLRHTPVPLGGMVLDLVCGGTTWQFKSQEKKSTKPERHTHQYWRGAVEFLTDCPLPSKTVDYGACFSCAMTVLKESKSARQASGEASDYCNNDD